MNLDYTTLRELVGIDSPSGFTGKACAYITEVLRSYGWHPEYTNKGAVRCALGQSPKLTIAAHTDTLGGIVSSIKSDGTLRLSKIGGPLLNAYEGSYCRIYSSTDQVLTGTLLLDNSSVHANREAGKTDRKPSTMHVRLDAFSTSREETESLGVQNGDFICFEPHFTELENGFIKSKFMDNKAGCFVLFEIARQAAESGKSYPVELFFSNYEEVGHGAATGFSKDIEEMLVIDMGVLGDGLAGKETACSICAKDSSGPYDYDFRKMLTRLAKEKNIPHAVDIYPFYGSDGSCALRAGHDFRVGLIGPGVSASHGVERTHKKGIEATIDLCMAYIEKKYNR